MSSYMYFYVRHKNTYAHLGSYSRNTDIYEFFDEDCGGAPYSTVAPIQRYNIERYRGIAIDGKNNAEKFLETVKNTRAEILTMNNPLEEKIQYLAENDNSKEYAIETIQKYNYILNFLSFLENIIDDYSYTDADADKTIYYGIECDNPNEKEDD